MTEPSRRGLESRDFDHTRAGRVLQQGAKIGLVIVLVVAALCFLWPSGNTIRRILLNIWLWATPTRRIREIIHPEDVEQFMNMLVFVPIIGLLALALPRIRWWVWFVVSAFIACGIETFQLLFLPGRHFDPVDAVFNTLGGWIGLFLALVLRWTLKRRHAKRADQGPAATPPVSSPASSADTSRTRS